LSQIIRHALSLSLHPAFIVPPFATLFAFGTTVTAGTLKKYLHGLPGLHRGLVLLVQ